MMPDGAQIRAARNLLGWSPAELARRAFLPLATVDAVEQHGSTFMLLPMQVTAIIRAFRVAGVEFTTTGPRPRDAS